MRKRSWQSSVGSRRIAETCGRRGTRNQRLQTKRLRGEKTKRPKARGTRLEARGTDFDRDHFEPSESETALRQILKS